MKGRVLKFWVIVGLGVLTVALLPTFERYRASSRRSLCQSNLKLIGLAVKQYVRDYDEKYPLVYSGEKGWMDVIMPYIKDRQSFHCPSDDKGRVEGRTDYFFNLRLHGQREDKITYIASSIMGGDGSGESASSASLNKLPQSWLSHPKSPSYRHLEGANYLFADGHVKWFKPDAITLQEPNISNVTFKLW